MSTPLDDLLADFDLAEVAPDVFTGPPSTIPFGFVFGGHVIAQAIVAGARTVPAERPLHSLHLYFVLPGDVTKPIRYEVERIRDGGAFTTRRVSALQGSAKIAEAMLSYQIEIDGVEHLVASDVPPRDPQRLPSINDTFAERHGVRVAQWDCFDLRWGGPYPVEEPHEPRVQTYYRLIGRQPDEQVLRQALIGYLSDIMFLSALGLPQGKSMWTSELRVSSLDHALWLHGRLDLDGWLTYDHRSPIARGSRGLVHGGFYTADGQPIASAAQEGFVRLKQS